MRALLALRLQGSRRESGPVDASAVGAVLADHGAELGEVLLVTVSIVDMMISVPASADLDQLAAELGPAAGFTQSSAKWSAPTTGTRGAAGEGYICLECGGVDGDHEPDCSRTQG